MTWGEAFRLTLLLTGDPSSQVGAAVAGWSHPLSREGMALLDLFDVTVRVNSKRQPKPYPRPWDPQPTRFGRATQSQREIRAALRARGHQ